MAELLKSKGYQKKGTALYNASTAALTVTDGTPLTVCTNENYNDSANIIKLSGTQIQLKAGKKYKLTGGTTIILDNTVAYYYIQFYNVTGSSYFGTKGVNYSNNWIQYGSVLQ